VESLVEFSTPSEDLDGVDFEMAGVEASLTFGSESSPLITWLSNATKTARVILGASSFITHSPKASSFGPIAPVNGKFGGYSAVYHAASTIDLVLVHYYDHGLTCYGTYTSLFLESAAAGACSDFPGTSVYELASLYGIPLNKIVIGKSLVSSDASSGYLSGEMIHAMVERAQTDLNWNAGVALYQYKADTAATFIQTVYPTMTNDTTSDIGHEVAIDVGAPLDITSSSTGTTVSTSSATDLTDMSAAPHSYKATAAIPILATFLCVALWATT